MMRSESCLFESTRAAGSSKKHTIRLVEERRRDETERDESGEVGVIGEERVRDGTDGQHIA